MFYAVHPELAYRLGAAQGIIAIAGTAPTQLPELPDPLATIFYALQGRCTNHFAKRIERYFRIYMRSRDIVGFTDGGKSGAEEINFCIVKRRHFLCGSVLFNGHFRVPLAPVAGCTAITASG